jgi:hypothetical protein
VLFVAAAGLASTSCLAPAPKIPHFPPRVALRIDVFGADAGSARSMFESVHRSNQGLSYVSSGGDGEILLGLDRDRARCVEPTAYCEYRVVLRIRNSAGAIVHSEQSSIGASAESCSRICDRALQRAATVAVSKAADLLKGESAGAVEPPVKEPAPTRSSRGKRKEPLVCAIASGTRLPSEEVEKRVAQADALRRQGILDQDEFDCLRKAFLSRL